METTKSLGLRPATEESKAGGQGFVPKRLARERRTIALMIGYYCESHHHASTALCLDCRQLLDYAVVRLERCQFGAEKPVCARCPVHCYTPFRREQVKTVMAYAGSRMLWQHPILSLRHWLDGFRKAPTVARTAPSASV